jgi:glucosamine--fructose-6-phosphate aminotransferase (isomerizing)
MFTENNSAAIFRPGRQAIMTSLMAQEIAESPDSIARLLDSTGRIQTIANAIQKFAPEFVVICARGSSGQAGVHLRYLIETRLGMASADYAPSIASAYGATLRLRGALFIVISQSGRSPDLLLSAQAAKRAGAFTLALVNQTDSPVANVVDHVLPLCAGPELAVPATKSVLASMTAGALLVNALAADTAFDQALERLPERLRAALALDWSPWGERLVGAPVAYVAGRGFGLGPALEIALKLAETVRTPALGYSAAELRHGPRAAITASMPVLLLRQSDAAAPAVDALAQDLPQAFVCGGPHGNLPWIGAEDPALDPLAMLCAAYRAVEVATRAAGFDPDKPPFLAKVTETL